MQGASRKRERPWLDQFASGGKRNHGAGTDSAPSFSTICLHFYRASADAVRARFGPLADPHRATAGDADAWRRHEHDSVARGHCWRTSPTDVDCFFEPRSIVRTVLADAIAIHRATLSAEDTTNTPSPAIHGLPPLFRADTDGGVLHLWLWVDAGEFTERHVDAMISLLNRHGPRVAERILDQERLLTLLLCNYFNMRLFETEEDGVD
jgi:hypothetical protein